MCSLSPDQGGYDPHPEVGTYNSPYCNSSTATSVIADCLPSGNPDEPVNSVTYGPTIINQVKGDIYKYVCDIKLFVSVYDRNHDIPKDLQDF